MRYIIVTYFLIFSSLYLKSQISIEGNIGLSNYQLSNKSSGVVSKDFSDFKSLISWRFSSVRNYNFANLSISTGLSIYSTGARNPFYDKWKNVYSGISLGLIYHKSKINFRIKSGLGFRLYSNIQVFSQGGGLSNKDGNSFNYNLDIEPGIEYLIWDNIGIGISYSYGLNDAIKSGKGVNYKNNMLYAGINYYFK